MPVTMETSQPAWNELIQQIGDLSMHIDDSTPLALTTERETALLIELGRELGSLLTYMTRLEDYLCTIKTDHKVHEAEWQVFRAALHQTLETSAELMRSLEEYRLTDLSGGFGRFVDELVKTLREHDCRFRAHSATHRALFRQNRKTIVKCAISGGWKTVCDVNSKLHSVAPVTGRTEGVTQEIVQRTEKSLVDYANSLDDKIKFLVTRLEETDERTRAMETQLQNLERYNKNLQEIVASRRDTAAFQTDSFSHASVGELANELQELKAKSARLKSILEKKCDCSRVQR